MDKNFPGCFQDSMCAETTLREFAVSLVLVILCEPVNVETESRNCSALEANHPCSNILAYVHRDIAVLIDR